jgi:heat shock protein HslJ
MKRKCWTGRYCLLLLAAVVFLTALFAGCSGSDDDPSSIIGLWQLQYFDLNDGTNVDVDDPSRYTIEFRMDGRVSIKADCNTCGGSYSADDTTINFGLLACTRAFCGDDSLDSEFEVVFVGTRTYRIDEGRLLIDYEEGSLVFSPAI